MEAANQTIIDCALELGIAQDVIKTLDEANLLCKKINEVNAERILALSEENRKLQDSPSFIVISAIGFILGLLIGVPIHI